MYALRVRLLVIIDGDGDGHAEAEGANVSSETVGGRADSKDEAADDVTRFVSIVYTFATTPLSLAAHSYPPLASFLFRVANPWLSLHLLKRDAQLDGQTDLVSEGTDEGLSDELYSLEAENADSTRLITI